MGRWQFPSRIRYLQSRSGLSCHRVSRSSERTKTQWVWEKDDSARDTVGKEK